MTEDLQQRMKVISKQMDISIDEAWQSDVLHHLANAKSMAENLNAVELAPSSLELANIYSVPPPDTQ